MVWSNTQEIHRRTTMFFDFDNVELFGYNTSKETKAISISPTEQQKATIEQSAIM